ncbi:probable 2-oxoglutarate-dependent dioxygenase At3g111800 [Triticum dicoccoides]|uniref:probable 2-oxoglutarate-dependent dioxygenase At3g111800 n=1 Tax=Triticum dicoccoides TaxID=85692 RepID=UPI00188EAAA9|nr:probable 2-oxoglutarate-dependent dioxygenase At3g111800 [Triticum dicoccoides]
MEAAGWPEPVVRVQSLSESGAATIPDRYVKPAHDRPSVNDGTTSGSVSIPVVDLSSPDGSAATARAVSEACREWGFFQAVNHGVPRDLLRRARAAWRGFFRLPVEAKQRYANSPATYEGYGSRLGVERGAVLDWGDYYFLHLRPPGSLSAADKWPHLPPDLRDATEEYGREVASLCERLMAAMSAGLGVNPGRLQEEFGGAEGAGVCVRVNYYPRCPQPELTLGLSSHSDPGGMTVLLADERVRGLQVRGRGGEWVTVDPIADAFIVNVGDQIQVLTNTTYRSVEHRVMVNADAERLSVAMFYNPRSDLPLAPMAELVSPGTPALYKPMTFDEYRLYIRRNGPRGKSQVESLKAHEDR